MSTRWRQENIDRMNWELWIESYSKRRGKKTVGFLLWLDGYFFYSTEYCYVYIYMFCLPQFIANSWHVREILLHSLWQGKLWQDVETRLFLQWLYTQIYKYKCIYRYICELFLGKVFCSVSFFFYFIVSFWAQTNQTFSMKPQKCVYRMTCNNQNECQPKYRSAHWQSCHQT